MLHWNSIKEKEENEAEKFCLPLDAALTGGQKRHKCTFADAILVFFVALFANCNCIVYCIALYCNAALKHFDFHSFQRHSVTHNSFSKLREIQRRQVICLLAMASHL